MVRQVGSSSHMPAYAHTVRDAHMLYDVHALTLQRNRCGLRWPVVCHMGNNAALYMHGCIGNGPHALKIIIYREAMLFTMFTCYLEHALSMYLVDEYMCKGFPTLFSFSVLFLIFGLHT